MAGLAELAGDYRDAALKLRMGLEDAKARLDGLDAPERAKLEGEMRVMRQMLREMRDLRRLCGGYYTGTRDGRYTTAFLTAPRFDSLK